MYVQVLHGSVTTGNLDINIASKNQAIPLNITL